MKPLAAPVLIALCRCLHLRRAADLAVQLTASLDPIGDELARRLPDRCDHAGAVTPIGRRLHGGIANHLRGRKAWIGMVLFGRDLDEKPGKRLLPGRMAADIRRAPCTERVGTSVLVSVAALTLNKNKQQHTADQ